MKKRRGHAAATTSEDLEGALAALDAAGLRVLVEEMLLVLDQASRARIVRQVVERATRAGSGWTPAPVPEEDVADVLAFVSAAERAGYVDPEEVDAFLGVAWTPSSGGTTPPRARSWARCWSPSGMARSTWGRTNSPAKCWAPTWRPAPRGTPCLPTW